MKILPSYFAALFTSLLLTLERKLPILSTRCALATGLAVLVIIVVVVIGAVVVYLVVTSGGTTTTTYP